jgi:hypothetical protein
MQPLAQEKPKSAPRAGASAPAVPEVFDMTAGPAVAGIGQRTLLDVCMDLFAKLESSLVPDRQEFVDAYFATLIKQDEMTTLWIEAAYYEQLRTLIQKEVLPLYDSYCATRATLRERTERRAWPRFSMWAIGIGFALEMLFTRGRVLRPQLLVPSLLVDGLIGYGVYYLVNFRDLSALKQARRDLIHSIRQLDAQHEVAKRYEIFRAATGGELLAAELQTLLAGYPEPNEFWRDYYAVRRADPTSAAELERLGITRFHDFLQLHVSGAYSPEARQQRFNALFLLAHKAFLLNDRENYVLDLMKRNNKDGPHG